MAEPRPLSRPPIREALVDIRIAADPAIDATLLETLRLRLSADYPHADERREVKAELRIEAGKLLPPSAQDLGFHGLVFSTADKTRHAQFRRDGLTLNHLGSYSGADPLIVEALRLWDMYREVVKPVGVTRIAMRYINQLELPYRQGDDFSRFLTGAPQMPAGAPQQVSSFLARMVAHDPPDVVIVTQKLEHVPVEKTTPVILDVDAFRPEALSPDREGLEGVLRGLRILKNRVFFALLTDEAVGLYV